MFTFVAFVSRSIIVQSQDPEGHKTENHDTSSSPAEVSARSTRVRMWCVSIDVPEAFPATEAYTDTLYRVRGTSYSGKYWNLITKFPGLVVEYTGISS